MTTATTSRVAENLTKNLNIANWWEKEIPGAWANVGGLYVGNVTIIPNTASNLLAKRNTGNRRTFRRNVELLQADMARGEWFLTGETIIFDRDGTLRNGQHRLLACVESGRPIQQLIVVGVEPGAFAYMDQTKRRTASDALGISGVKYEVAAGAACGMFYRFLKTGYPNNFGIATPNKCAIDIYHAHPKIAELVTALHHTNKPCIYPSKSLLACLGYIYSLVDAQAAEAFVNAVLENHAPDDSPRWAPVNRLNEKMAKNRIVKTQKLRTHEIANYTTQAWNLYMKGEGRYALRMFTNRMPDVFGWVYEEGRPVGFVDGNGNLVPVTPEGIGQPIPYTKTKG